MDSVSLLESMLDMSSPSMLALPREAASEDINDGSVTPSAVDDAGVGIGASGMVLVDGDGDAEAESCRDRARVVLGGWATAIALCERLPRLLLATAPRA